MNVFMYEHARTISTSAASAPIASSFATVLTNPFLLAICSAERLLSVSCRGTYTHLLAPCANAHLPPPFSPRTPLLPALPARTPHTTHSTPRLLCDLQVKGTGLLSRLQQLCCRCLVGVLARHHQARHPALHVCVCMHMSACMYMSVTCITYRCVCVHQTYII